MKTFGSLAEILDFAIREEEKAAAFYRNLAAAARDPQTRKLYESFALEEDGHKHKLQTVVIERQDAWPDDLAAVRVHEVPDVEVRPDLDRAAILQLVMKKELEAFRLYTALAGLARDPEQRALLDGLAQEEARHKLSFELEYDELSRKA